MWIGVAIALSLALARVLWKGRHLIREHTPGTLEAWAAGSAGTEDQFQAWIKEDQEPEALTNPNAVTT